MFVFFNSKWAIKIGIGLDNPKLGAGLGKMPFMASCYLIKFYFVTICILNYSVNI